MVDRDHEKHEAPPAVGGVAIDDGASGDMISSSAVEQSKELRMPTLGFNGRTMDQAKEAFEETNGHEAPETAVLKRFRPNLGHETHVRRQVDIGSADGKDSGWRKAHAGEAAQERQPGGPAPRDAGIVDDHDFRHFRKSRKIDAKMTSKSHCRRRASPPYPKTFGRFR